MKEQGGQTTIRRMHKAGDAQSIAPLLAIDSVMASFGYKIDQIATTSFVDPNDGVTVYIHETVVYFTDQPLIPTQEVMLSKKLNAVTGVSTETLTTP